MDYSLMTRLVAEMIGTALLIILGNGAVANVDLKGTKGYGSDWMLIAVGYGCGVMMPAMILVVSVEIILTQRSQLLLPQMVYSHGLKYYLILLLN